MRVYIQAHISWHNIYLQEYITGIEFNIKGLCEQNSLPQIMLETEKPV